MTRLLCLTVAAIVVQAGAVPRKPLHLFLLAGQSNMAGRGTVEPDDRVVHPRVWTFDRVNQWVPALDPLHFDKPIAGVGPGRAFGVAVANANASIHVGLVPAAVGGSAIVSWQPGAVHAETGAKPYDDAIARVRAARADGEFKAILWHQGEADSTAEAAPLYEDRLRDVLTRLRAEIGNPEVLVLIGQLGRFSSSPWPAAKDQVDAVHRRLAATMKNVVFVSADGLTDKGDGIHFDSASARTLGRRYADAYERWSRSNRR